MGGRSSPGPPRYLLRAIYAVEALLAEAAGPMTPAEIAAQLDADGFRWPLSGGRERYSRDGTPTPERVRRVCEIRGARTKITRAGGRPVRYQLDPLLAR